MKHRDFLTHTLLFINPEQPANLENMGLKSILLISFLSTEQIPIQLKWLN